MSTIVYHIHYVSVSYNDVARTFQTWSPVQQNCTFFGFFKMPKSSAYNNPSSHEKKSKLA